MNASVMSSSGLHRLMGGAYEAAYERVRTALKAAGFEVLAEINFAEFLSKKSQSYIRPYKIVVVYSSEIAQRALTVSPATAAVLPTNVAISQTQDDQVEVRMADPRITWNTESDAYLKPIAEELNNRLEQVIDALKG